MLEHVNYQEIDDDESYFSLVDLEYGVLENCRVFLENLKSALIDENKILIHEFLVAHLCAYLGTVVALHTVHDAEKLEPAIIELIKHQAKAAYHHFNQHPINSTIKSVDKKNENLEKLRKSSPGSIVAQTVRLGRVVMDILEELHDHHNTLYPDLNSPKQTSPFCSNETLIKLMMLIAGEQCAEWREELDGLSDNYVINQLAIQIGWLIGYFSHLEKKEPIDTNYFEYSLPLLSLYREHIYKLMSAYANIQHAEEERVNNQKNAEAEAALKEIRQLSKKAYAQKLPAISLFQKQIMITQAGIEKTVIDLLMQGLEVKLILMSLFYFWFSLEAPLHSKNPKLVDTTDGFSHMLPIIDLVKQTIKTLPKPDLTPEIRALNEKMQLLKANLPHPEILDNVSHEKAVQQTELVNTAIHTITCDYLKQDIKIDAITNVLFSHWLRFSVFFGVSESDWQKMDFYLPEILEAVRSYLSTIHHR